MCLSPLRDGLLARCKRVICVDGCFLKGLYEGQLLSTVGIEANNCICPVAWVVVNKENMENWMPFLQLLDKGLRITHSYRWAFMSNRQKVSSFDSIGSSTFVLDLKLFGMIASLML